MPASSFGRDDAVYAALQALHCPPDEVAQALDVELRTLWSWHGGDVRLPGFVVERLIDLLESRADYLRDVATLLAAGHDRSDLRLAS